MKWPEYPLARITERFLSGGTSSTKILEYWTGDIPWITGADILDGEVILGRRYINKLALKNSATNVVPKGSLLIVTRTGVRKISLTPIDKDVRTINEHIQNIFEEGELSPESVIRTFRITASDGKPYETNHYNLDVTISVGYRVKSHRGTQFRIWATQRLREYIIKGSPWMTSVSSKRRAATTSMNCSPASGISGPRKEMRLSLPCRDNWEWNMEPGFFIKNIWALRKGLLAGMEIKAKYLEEYNERQA